jgi:hypothetical protein
MTPAINPAITIAGNNDVFMTRAMAMKQLPKYQLAYT